MNDLTEKILKIADEAADLIDGARKESYEQGRADAINAIKNDLHKRLTEEMNKPYQDQGLCQGLYFGIQRCDWYLDDSKEQSNTYTATVDGVKREFM